MGGGTFADDAGSCWPQVEQKALPSGLGLPHLEQNTASPWIPEGWDVFRFPELAIPENMGKRICGEILT